MTGAKRTAVSIVVATALVATALASMWLMASAGVFSSGQSQLPSSPAGAGPLVTSALGGFQVDDDYPVGQPRDPFQPLITTPPPDETSTTSAGGTTTTSAGGTTTTSAGGTTTTSAGGTTTTTGDQPSGVRVTLWEIRSEQSGLVAVVEVDGVSHTVEVGDTFATDFKVVSLTSNAGVFTYKGNAFTLAVGQSILK
ncbi:MAG: hypothetical protein QY307_00765 [Acidimicrobiia bacterium]|nr:MAG: hypothetical protein QY307_00765 [Acidimicrobiia bacterium]